MQTAQADLDRTRAVLDKAFAGDSLGAKNVAKRMHAWAEQRHRLVSASLALVLAKSSCGRCGSTISALPASRPNHWPKLGLEIKRRSPLPHDLSWLQQRLHRCASLLKRLPKGMEVIESHYNYLLASQLTGMGAAGCRDHAANAGGTAGRPHSDEEERTMADKLLRDGRPWWPAAGGGSSAVCQMLAVEGGGSPSITSDNRSLPRRQSS
ncbi:MAG: hypothetical protein U0992_24205 [Planctomycetaceae bacterium]